MMQYVSTLQASIPQGGPPLLSPPKLTGPIPHQQMTFIITFNTKSDVQKKPYCVLSFLTSLSSHCIGWWWCQFAFSLADHTPVATDSREDGIDGTAIHDSQRWVKVTTILNTYLFCERYRLVAYQYVLCIGISQLPGQELPLIFHIPLGRSAWATEGVEGILN